MGWVLFDAVKAANLHNAALYIISRKNNGKSDRQTGSYLSQFVNADGGQAAYLADIDRQAQERFERLIEDMKLAQIILERLKAENAMEWTRRMNTILASAMEIFALLS